MSEEFKEVLSALMDGELPQARAAHSIELLERNPELRLHWERYHLVRDVLCKNLPDPMVASLRERVRSAVAAEPPTSSYRPRWQPSHPRRFALAVAACVTAVAGLGAAVWLAEEVDRQRAATAEVATTAPGPRPQTVAVADVEAPPVGAVAEDPARKVRGNELAPVVERRLNGYLVNHTEYARGGMRGMLPYARIVAYERGVQ